MGCLPFALRPGIDLGMWPDQELNPWLFSVWGKAPTNWTTPARALKKLSKEIQLFKIRRNENYNYLK